MKCDSCDKEVKNPKEWEEDMDLCIDCIFDQHGGEIRDYLSKLKQRDKPSEA